MDQGKSLITDIIHVVFEHLSPLGRLRCRSPSTAHTKTQETHGYAKSTISTDYLVIMIMSVFLESLST